MGLCQTSHFSQEVYEAKGVESFFHVTKERISWCKTPVCLLILVSSDKMLDMIVFVSPEI